MASPKKIVEKIARIVGAKNLITDPARLDEISWDALSEARIHPAHKPPEALPLCVAVPESSAQVRELVVIANETRTPLIPYGGGSGLMGGALTIRPAIVLDLRRMKRVVAIDAEAMSARVEAGAVLESVEQKLNEQGFILGHDPWTLPVATIGGAISTNSVGYRAGKYGSMGEQVLGLEVVLANGEILRTRAVPKSSAGIDLNALFIGGEGCFGVVAEATIRIFVKPEKSVIRAYGFATFERGYDAIREIFKRGVEPAVIDFGDNEDKFDGALLYLAFEGAAEIVAAEERIALAILDQAGATRLPDAQAAEFWAERHSIARRFAENRRARRERGRDGIYRDWIHVALAASQVLPFRKQALDLVKRRSVDLVESGLWIRPELFSMPLRIDGAGRKDAQLILEDTVEELLRLVHKLGGSMEYTHGVGVKLAPLMREEHGYGLDVMRGIKKLLDPNDIMNPGKMGL